MGYLILDKQITVPFGPGNTRTLLKGINKDITPEMAEHWYVRGAGGRYVETLAEADKAAPGARESVQRARADWEQSVRNEMAAHATQVAMRKDLERLEKEFGVDTRGRDKEFEDSIREERKRLDALEKDTLDRAEAQAAANAGDSLSPAQAERMAAGSEEVANTEMTGPAAADAAASAGGVDPSQQLPRSAPDGALGASSTEQAAAGSAEGANTTPEGQPRVDAQRQDPSQKDAGKAADVTDGGAKTATGEKPAADAQKADEQKSDGKDAPKADDKKADAKK